MTTAATFRRVILDCAQEATKEEPRDLDARARSFGARLCGALQYHDEVELVNAVGSVVGFQPVAEGG